MGLSNIKYVNDFILPRSRFLKEAREKQRNVLLNVCLVGAGGGGGMVDMSSGCLSMCWLPCWHCHVVPYHCLCASHVCPGLARPDQKSDTRSNIIKPMNACPQEYLERYYMLIAFSGYLASGQFDPGSDSHQDFPTWMSDRPELRRWAVELDSGWM